MYQGAKMVSLEIYFLHLSVLLSPVLLQSQAGSSYKWHISPPLVSGLSSLRS